MEEVAERKEGRKEGGREGRNTFGRQGQPGRWHERWVCSELSGLADTLVKFGLKSRAVVRRRGRFVSSDRRHRLASCTQRLLAAHAALCGRYRHQRNGRGESWSAFVAALSDAPELMQGKIVQFLFQHLPGGRLPRGGCLART